jgi:hypothetical protein
MATRMQQRRGSAAQWTAANPVLAAGEIGFETDTSKFKMGNGTSTWSQLVYFANATELTNAINSVVGMAPETLNTLSEISDALGDNPDFLSLYATNSRVDGIVLNGQSVTTNAITKAETELLSHAQDETGVHGIANTALLATKVYADGAADAAVDAAVAALTKSSVGLSNVDDTADAFKPVSAAQATAIATAKTEAITAAGTAADTKVSTHNTDTSDVHGIADTSLLALKSEVAAVTKTSLGLGSVDNTADTAKPVSTAQSTAIATAKAEAIADATSQVNALLTGAPAALNTLDELAAALGDDANFAATVTTNLGLKVDSLTPISQKTASYTLSSLTERDDLIEMGSASAITLSIPTDATLNYPIGTSIDILQTGAGQVTIAAVTPGTTTVNATPGLKLRTTWSSATLFKRAANTWVVFGDLSA